MTKSVSPMGHQFDSIEIEKQEILDVVNTEFFLFAVLPNERCPSGNTVHITLSITLIGASHCQWCHNHVIMLDKIVAGILTKIHLLMMHDTSDDFDHDPGSMEDVSSSNEGITSHPPDQTPNQTCFVLSTTMGILV